MRSQPFWLSATRRAGLKACATEALHFNF